MSTVQWVSVIKINTLKQLKKKLLHTTCVNWDLCTQTTGEITWTEQD